MKFPVLQVALDMMNAHRALQIAAEAVEGGADWLEAGTPLIKSEGMEVVRELKRRFKGHVIVADMKTVDVGGFEVEIAAKAGADIVCVLGVSDTPTITEAVKAARKYGAKIMVDLLGCADKAARAKELPKLGVDYLCVHVGVDQQMVGGNPMEELAAVAKVSKVPVAAAGGINSETAARAVKLGASIVIIGGAIIKAEKVANATRNIKKAISDKKSVRSELFTKYSQSELREAFLKVSTPNISDAMHRKGAMHHILPHIKRNRKMVGRAITVRTVDGDWAKPVEAIDRASKGDVIVIDACAGHTAVWGELASWSCKLRGIEGVVIDGAARDIDAILEIDFPVFSRFTSPNAGEPKGHGEIGAEIACGGVPVRTGDWVIGDGSGVVVVPQEDAVETANRAIDVMERENRLREEIKRGSTLSIVEKLEKWEKVG
ncbi:MAG: orotidine 5'-phosphate decarboxylase [Euryarchaeota archaeon]|nr:orotidine 5'-phosphate decarboxylase [Euryarchaeota archaeon]